MNETFCNYSGKRDETIVAYLYGEMEGDDRAAFDRHLVACAPCRAELVDLRLRAVRSWRDGRRRSPRRPFNVGSASTGRRPARSENFGVGAGVAAT
jgi:hypothetical protein